MFVCYLTKNGQNRLIKKHYTSTEAVKLFEDDDNEVFKLLKDGYCQSIYRISDYTRSFIKDESPTRL